MIEGNRNLTVLITTYNRKTSLLHTLDCLYRQGHHGEYSIVVSDNHSDYNVKEAIQNSFPREFTDNIIINTWRFNTGMSTNISISFLLVETDWCWFVSDDDEIFDGALEHALVESQNTQKHVAIKFSLERIAEYNNQEVTSLDELCGFYNRHNTGEKYYLAMMYNLKLMSNYLIGLTQYSYSYLSFWIPILNALKDGKGSLKFSSFIAYKYKEANDGWKANPQRRLNTYLGLRTFPDSYIGLSKSQYRLITKIFHSPEFSPHYLVTSILQVEDKKLRREYYRKLSPFFQGPLVEKLFFRIIFHLGYMCNIKQSFFHSLGQIIRKKK